MLAMNDLEPNPGREVLTRPADSRRPASSIALAETETPSAPLRRGRPVEMAPLRVLERIRQLAGRPAGLFRVHRTHSALYARARRQFGSWAEAVAAAGVDYRRTLDRARERSVATRRRRRRRPVT